jgi:hypothetical protein
MLPKSKAAVSIAANGAEMQAAIAGARPFDEIQTGRG